MMQPNSHCYPKTVYHLHYDMMHYGYTGITDTLLPKCVVLAPTATHLLKLHSPSVGTPDVVSMFSTDTVVFSQCIFLCIAAPKMLLPVT